MQAQLSEKDAEVSRLRKLIEDKKMKAQLEKENADVAKNEVDELLVALDQEKSKVMEAYKNSDTGAKKAKDSLSQLEVMGKDIKEARS